MRSRTSTPEHWSAYWERDEDGGSYTNGDRLVDAVRRHRDPRGLRVLEVGPGTGRDAVRLAEMGAVVVGVDYVAGSLHIVRRHAGRAGVAVGLVHGDATRSPFADGSFDVVFHQGLLEHFRDPVPLLVENARILRPGGLLIVDVPQRWHPYTVLKHTLIAVDRWFAGWETEFSVRELERLVAATGLRVVDRYGEWMVPNLAYRAVRRGLADAGVAVLPLYPRGPAPLRRARTRLRDRLLTTPLPLWTGSVGGVVAEKPSPSAG